MIKYYDNNKESVYDENWQRVSNWNPNGEYADNEYANVYFRIECPAYYQNPCGVGFNNDLDEQAFDKDVSDTFRNIGWNIGKYTFVSDRDNAARKGKSCLFLHPQNISGEVLKKDVKAIAEALAQHDTFHIRYVDIFETVYDMTDEEYRSYLDANRNEIKSALLNSCKTKRTAMFYNLYERAFETAKKFRLRRVNDEDGKYGYSSDGCYGTTDNYMVGVIAELVQAGYLIQIEQHGKTYIRTINKTEQKKLKLYIN